MKTIEEQHVSKLILRLQGNADLFRKKELNYILGLTTTQIKDLKKFAISENLIEQKEKSFYVTEKGKEFLKENPFMSWKTEHRPDVSLECLKLEKAPPTLTKAIRALARHLLEGEELKENSTEHYLIKELLCSSSPFAKFKKEIEKLLLSEQRINLNCVFEKFVSSPFHYTKAIILILLLEVLYKNKEELAIYENYQFCLKLDTNMFDRIMSAPQRFEVQKTVLDLPVVKQISKVLTGQETNNVLILTKALMIFVSELEKYTLNTEHLSKTAIRLRNTVKNAKDPMSLWYRDIPLILCEKILCQCDEELAETLKQSIDELKNSYPRLIKEISDFTLKSFNAKNIKDLSKRFLNVSEYISDVDLKILSKTLEKSSENIIERIATIINKKRVPKDWSDEDLSDYRLKITELALKFKTIEASTVEIKFDKQMNNILCELLKLSKPKQIAVLKKVVNG